MGKGHYSLTVYVCGFERASVLGGAPSNSDIQCSVVCTYAYGGCGWVAKPLECIPGSQIHESVWFVVHMQPQ